MRMALWMVAFLVVVAPALGQEQPAKPKAKVEFRWLEDKPIKDLTDEKGFQSTCWPDRLSYAHRKPVLTHKDVFGTRLNKIDFSGNGLPGDHFMIDFDLTKEAKATLVAACGEASEGALAVFVDGKYWGASFFKKASADDFAPFAGFITARAEAERIVEACRQADDKPQVIMGWGTVIDPDKDCKVTEEKGKLTIKVPGSLHDLYPGQTDPKKRNNAPRVLQEVKGDFVAKVKVTADWKPGDKLPGSTTVPYNGAGLLVWESDTHLIRFERNVFVRPGMRISYTTPLQYADGRGANAVKSTTEEFFQGRSTWLKVERTGEKLTTSISHDGEKWIETATLAAKLGETLRVGVEAVNSSNTEFSVEFEAFTVIVK